MNRQYFPALDELRFISFLLVFLLHLPKAGVPAIDYFLKSGGVGVIFFFVLSGFLITYILLSEKLKTGTISLQYFFARRILKIWPLFYVMILFAYVVPYLLTEFNLPAQNSGYKPNLFVSLIFGENYHMMFTNSYPDGAPLRVMWTICIEEHFYLIWAPLLYFIPFKKIPNLILFSIVASNIARPLYRSWGIEHLDLITNLDYFAFGAIPAYILVTRHELVQLVLQPTPTFKSIFLLFVLSCVFIIPNVDSYMLHWLSPFMWGLLFSFTILLNLYASASKLRYRSWVSRLGSFTYGLYLYHTIVILSVTYLFQSLSISNWYLMATISLLLSLLVSVISYNIFERHFLSLKKHFRK